MPEWKMLVGQVRKRRQEFIEVVDIRSLLARVVDDAIQNCVMVS
jgi:hypothetical protein